RAGKKWRDARDRLRPYRSYSPRYARAKEVLAMRNATQLANDAAADYFEKAHSSEGPDIIEELESTELEALMVAQRSAAAANAALKGAVRAARRNCRHVASHRSDPRNHSTSRAQPI